jgi:tellurite resistance protein TerC
MFRYLKVGLSFVLCFVGIKMTIVDILKIPIGISLGTVATILLLSIVASVLIPAKTPQSTIGGLGHREDS